MGLTCFHRAGLLPLEDFAERVPVQAVVEPRPQYADLYDGVYAQFVQAFRKNRKIFHTLNPLSR